MSTDVQGAPAVPGILTLGVLAPVSSSTAATPRHDGFPVPLTLDELDEQLLTLLLRRAELARQEQRGRRENGLPVRSLTHENAMTRRYADRLGRLGAEIAVAVLALSRWRPGG